MKAWRVAVSAALAALLALLAPVPVTASHTQSPRRGLREIGFHPLLGKGGNGVVWVHPSRGRRLVAYVGGFACRTEIDNPADPEPAGIRAVDITNPRKPRLVKVFGTVTGAQQSEVRVTSVRTRWFSGELLAGSLEPCSDTGSIYRRVFGEFPPAQTGFQLFDVSRPEAPVRLSSFSNGGYGSHNIYLYTRPDLRRAYVAAVWNGDGVEQTGLQLVDVSNPRRLRLVSTWRLRHAERDGGPSLSELCKPRSPYGDCYLHDVWISSDGKMAYLSYWDAGLIVLDISAPARPRFIGQAQKQVGWLDDPGDIHSAVPMTVGGRKLVVVGVEDFDAGVLPTLTVARPRDIARHYQVTHVANTRSLSPAVRGRLAYVRSGCTPADYDGVDARGKVVLAERFVLVNGVGSCTNFVRMQLAERMGARAVVQIDDDDQPDQPEAVRAGIPGVQISSSQGARIRRRVLARTPVDVRLGVGPIVDEWGFMRVVDVTSRDPARWREVYTFKAPHVAEGTTNPTDIYAAHNPMIGPDGRVYFSWYTNGVRVLEPDRRRPGRFREVAWFVPRSSDHPDDYEPDNSGFWQSFPIRHPRTGNLIVVNSDINRGIYIVEPT